ncbi:MAG: 4-alpha-glucanotransferase, partial [Muribaculaceae bacterium]|nr:4-alpha-glucanotransferase [Muribaculaceae bacterium]
MLFKVITPRVADDMIVKVVGSCPELGNWSPRDGVRMDAARALPLYTATVPYSLPADLEYKLIICRGEEVMWEEGPNRSLANPGPLDFRGREKWHATGVAIPVFSLRSADDFGVGDFEDLKLMADWAADRQMSVIQILPVNDTTMT